ncbi:MAG: gamma-glutamyl-gamma-aminobutyrate hydrolase family protein [Gammaproteobacteria bacterium]
MTAHDRRPLIGIATDRKIVGHHYFHMAGEKYIDAVVNAAGGLPVLIPSLGSRLDIGEVLDQVDGLLMTGALSNVEPHRYDKTLIDPDTLVDPGRDATTLPLIVAAVDAGLPLFSVCRGLQEMNVAFGGTLHQKVHDVAGQMDHREPPNEPPEVMFALRHEVALTPGGMLERLVGARTVMVNSLHSQGVDRLGERLIVEATAPDDLIEAFRVDESPAFALAVQWHPEWQVMKNPFSVALFRAFGDAVREHAAR